MAKATKDSYSNKAYGSVTESAANTLTFTELQTQVSIYDKVAWVIQRMEWYLTPAQIGLLVDSADQITLALTASNMLTALSLSSAGVIDMFDIQKTQASSVGFQITQMPVTRDFGGLAGGGLIIAPRPLYVAVKGTGLASAAGAAVRIYYTVLELQADEYLELIDFYRIVQ